MGLTLNHDWFDDAAQSMEVASLVLISSVLPAGFDPPATPVKLMVVGFNTNAAGIGSLTVPISTKARSAGGNELVEALPPTTTPNRGLLNTFTTLPGN
jgi:hypothetical protein